MRVAKIERKTKETNIVLSIDIDGNGKVDSQTGIGFLDHMIISFGKHAGFDIHIKAVGDLSVDCHHTVEDIGIVLGQAISQAIDDKKGIVRFSDCFVPMDEALAFSSLDVSGRGYCDFKADFQHKCCGDLETDSVGEFFKALAMNANVTLHLRLVYGENDHHKIEALFKSCARCFKESLTVHGEEIPSSKGLL